MPLVKLGLAEDAFHHFKRHTSSRSLHLLPGGSTCATEISFESAFHRLTCMACCHDLLSLEIQRVRSNMKICLAPLVLPYIIFLQFHLLWPRHLKRSFSKLEKRLVDIAQKKNVGSSAFHPLVLCAGLDPYWICSWKQTRTIKNSRTFVHQIPSLTMF